MSAAAGPDVRQLQSRELPAGEFPGDGPRDFRICMARQVHDEVTRHAAEDMSVEICGVLVGRWGRDRTGPYVHVSAAIRGDAASSKFAEVTFTHETWSKINQRMDHDFAGESIVGWYHSHPDFGIFLSDRDRFIHEHFFSEPGQIAHVIDPVRKEEGFFTWSAGKPARCAHYWIGTDIQVAPPVGSDGVGASQHGDDQDRIRRKEAEASQPLGRWTIAAIAGCLFLLGFFVHDQFASWERRRVYDAVEASMDALQIERLRLHDELSTATRDLQVGVSSLLLVGPSPGAGVDPATSRGWDSGIRQLGQAADRIESLRKRYAINERELSQLAAMIGRTQAAAAEARAQSARNSTTQSASQPAGSADAAAADAPSDGTRAAAPVDEGHD